MLRIARQVGLLGLTMAMALGAAAAAPPPGETPAVQPKGTSKKKSRGRRPEPAKKDEMAADPAPKAEPSDGSPVFSRDIAPVLIANCLGCHNERMKRGEFVQVTFRKLMAGGKSGAVIEPGKPEESRLIQMIKGEDGVPKMPPGNRKLGDETVAKIEAWVKAGAVLDAGKDPAANLTSYASSVDQLREAELTKLSPADRDKRTEDKGRERLTKADPKAAPEVTSNANFLLLGNLPKSRTTATLKGLDAAKATIRAILGPAAKATLDGPEKISFYVFADRAHYVEFVRSIENRDVEPDAQSHGNLGVESPYLAAIDPLAGAEESASAKRPAPRSKRVEEPSGPERSLVGLLAESLGASATTRAGNAPRWLASGLGAYLASQAEPRSPYLRRLRGDAFKQYQLNWVSKANEALGGETDAEKVKAVGFAIVEWLVAEYRPAFAGFARGMIEGGDKLDDVLGQTLNANREQFLQGAGRWVAARYGSRR